MSIKVAQTEPGDINKDQTLQGFVDMEGFLSLFKENCECKEFGSGRRT